MDIFEAIKNRRSIGKVKADSIKQELVEQLLEAATWAPNHYKTEPWRFFVLTGEGRRPLGRVLADITKGEMEDPATEENQKKLRNLLDKPFRAPVVIAVAASPSEEPRALRIEEIGAVNVAIQNMLLAAHGLGLGAIWRTGKSTYHPKMKELFGLREKDEMLGFIYVGEPDLPPRTGIRTSYTAKTKWIDTDRSYT